MQMLESEPLRGSYRVVRAIKKTPLNKGVFLLAASHGFEPRLTESESAVLPLDDEAKVFYAWFVYIKNFLNAILF